MKTKYVLIADRYRSRLKPGDRLPTLRQLADDNGVSVVTARKARDQLVAEGLISEDGWFRTSQRLRLHAFPIDESLSWAADTREQDTDTFVKVRKGPPLVRQVRRSWNGIPHNYAEWTFTARVVARMPELRSETDIPSGTVALLEALEWPDVEQDITLISRMPSPAEKALLGMSRLIGVPIWVENRVGRQYDQTLFWAYRILRADRIEWVR